MRLGGPAIGAQLAQLSMAVVDTIMAGQLGAEALAAVSIGGSVWMPVIVTGMGLLMSVSPSVAQSFGAGRLLDCGQHLRQGIWLALVVAACLVLLMQFAEPVMRMFGVTAALIPTAAAFLRAVSWGIPGVMLFVALRGFCEGVSTTRPVLLISLAATVGNIFGNWVFMYGHLGFPAMGAVGSGVSTAIVEWLMALGLALWIACQGYYREFAPFHRFEPPKLAAIGQLLRVGGPIAASLFCEVTCFAFAGLLIGRFGAEVVAGHQIALNLASLTFMVPLGVSIAVCVRVGQFIGAGQPERARWSGTVGTALCGGFMLLAAAGFALLPQMFVGLYTADPKVRAMAARLLLLAALFQLFDGIQVASAGALRGLKDTRATMAITIVAYWALGLPVGVWLGLSLDWGAPGFWTGFIVALAFAAALLAARFQFAMNRHIGAIVDEP